MSDDEWDRLRETFQKEQRAMPGVLTKARADRKRALIGLVVLYAMLAPIAVLMLVQLRHAVAIADFAAPLFVLSIVAIILMGVHRALGGTLAEGALTPGQLLDGLERRHAGRRKLLRVMRWVGAYVLSGIIVAGVHGWIASGRVDAPTAIAVVVILAFAISTHLFLERWASGRIARDLQEVAEARRLMAEDGDERLR